MGRRGTINCKRENWNCHWQLYSNSQPRCQQLSPRSPITKWQTDFSKPPLNWLLLGLSHFLSLEVVLPTWACPGAHADSNRDHIKNVMRAKHLYSMCDQPNISLHQLCFLPCQNHQGVYQNFPQLFELLFRLEGASLTTWIFPVGNSFFQLFRQHMNAQAVMSPGDRKFQFQRECMTATLYRSGDSKCLFICWLYILFPPKNSINHTDQNTSV